MHGGEVFGAGPAIMRVIGAGRGAFRHGLQGAGNLAGQRNIGVCQSNHRPFRIKNAAVQQRVRAGVLRVDDFDLVGRQFVLVQQRFDQTGTDNADIGFFIDDGANNRFLRPVGEQQVEKVFFGRDASQLQFTPDHLVAAEFRRRHRHDALTLQVGQAFQVTAVGAGDECRTEMTVRPSLITGLQRGDGVDIVGFSSATICDGLVMAKSSCCLLMAWVRHSGPMGLMTNWWLGISLESHCAVFAQKALSASVLRKFNTPMSTMSARTADNGISRVMANNPIEMRNGKGE